MSFGFKHPPRLNNPREASHAGTVTVRRLADFLDTGIADHRSGRRDRWFGWLSR